MNTFPDDTPADADGDALRALAEAGFDFSVPHDVDFFAVFPDEAAASAAVEAYMEDDEASPIESVQAASSEGRFELTFIKNMRVTHAGILSFEEELGARVEAGGGQLDGWGITQ
ncbi:MAG: hypothetical protein ACJA2W_002349 [Planctomycetota bacterium]|jgi:hypothetical protein